MNTISVFAGLCGFFACALVGLWWKRRLLFKAKFYEDYRDYLFFASEKIGYERMPLAELNETFSHKCEGAFTALLLGESRDMPLSDGAISEVKDYLLRIGTTDADTQIASLRAKCAEMKRFAENDCVKFRKDAVLSFKIAVLVGLVVFILLV